MIRRIGLSRTGTICFTAGLTIWFTASAPGFPAYLPTLSPLLLLLKKETDSLLNAMHNDMFTALLKIGKTCSNKRMSKAVLLGGDVCFGNA